MYWNGLVDGIGQSSSGRAASSLRRSFAALMSDIRPKAGYGSLVKKLTETLLAETNRPTVVSDLVDVVNQEVHEKKGVSGMTVKAAVGTVRKVSPNVIGSAIDKMLPDFAMALEPFWADFGGSGDFGTYLSGRGEEAANALVSVTDQKAENTSRAPLRKAYSALRPRAIDNVTTALPRLGAVIQKHAAG
jgi:hypothetical protein